ncbi:hypothetical protein GCM10009017_17670 [Halarchaeum rubridurum]|uniref:Uncharacterized protein n=1 Tax=Halarchaeum rubridurum TaxID=489911 RepID=A0A830FZJ8_9EURY|nr:hypothetical protein GCM10009017_17670 [Halarchaeum rubridurum]
MSVALAGCTNGSGTDGNGTDGGGDGTTTTPVEESCPALRDADRTVCAATTGADAPVVLRPSATSLGAPGTLRFTLSNGGASTLGTNPYDWAVHRETAAGWERVAPDATVEPWRELPPGASQAWLLGVGTAPTPEDDAIGCGPLDLDDGTYAFSVAAQGDDGWTAYVARFRVV